MSSSPSHRETIREDSNGEDVLPSVVEEGLESPNNEHAFVDSLTIATQLEVSKQITASEARDSNQYDQEKFKHQSNIHQQKEEEEEEEEEQQQQQQQQQQHQVQNELVLERNMGSRTGKSDFSAKSLPNYPPTSPMKVSRKSRTMRNTKESDSELIVSRTKEASERIGHAFDSGKNLLQTWNTQDTKLKDLVSYKAHSIDNVEKQLGKLLDEPNPNTQNDGIQNKEEEADLKHIIQILTQQIKSLEIDGADALQNWVEYMSRCAELQKQLLDSETMREYVETENKQLRVMVSALQAQLTHSTKSTQEVLKKTVGGWENSRDECEQLKLKLKESRKKIVSEQQRCERLKFSSKRLNEMVFDANRSVLYEREMQALNRGPNAGKRGAARRISIRNAIENESGLMDTKTRTGSKLHTGSKFQTNCKSQTGSKTQTGSNAQTGSNPQTSSKR